MADKQSPLESRYPNTTYFVDALGWVEIGHNYDSPLTSFIKALDTGGMVWEGKDMYATLEDALQDLEQGITEWMRECGIESK